MNSTESHPPTISVSITTSTPTLKLSKHSPFTITLTLTLSHTHPITFEKRSTSLFDGKTLHQDGLQFTNISTGQAVPRNSIDICYEASSPNGNMPSEASKNNFTTLYPGKEVSIEATIEPLLTEPLWEFLKPVAERQEGKRWMWPHVGGFENGESYEDGLSEGLAVGAWMKGSVERLVEGRKQGLKPIICREPVRYVVERRARFEVLRLDGDGSLNWP